MTEMEICNMIEVEAERDALFNGKEGTPEARIYIQANLQGAGRVLKYLRINGKMKYQEVPGPDGKKMGQYSI